MDNKSLEQFLDAAIVPLDSLKDLTGYEYVKLGSADHTGLQELWRVLDHPLVIEGSIIDKVPVYIEIIGQLSEGGLYIPENLGESEGGKEGQGIVSGWFEARPDMGSRVQWQRYGAAVGKIVKHIGQERITVGDLCTLDKDTGMVRIHVGAFSTAKSSVSG